MLLYLAEYLARFDSSFLVFQYLTLRAILGVLTALLISLLVGPPMIRRLSRHQIGQTVRDDGPESHFSKAGTPTMGGALLLVAIASSALLWSDLGNRYVWVVLLVTLVFGAIGLVDDYKKLVLRNSRGLAARYKYFWQSLAGLAAALALYFGASGPSETALLVPYLKDVSLQLGPWFILLTYFVIVGSSNAVNLTDGLDGLAIMPTVLVARGPGHVRLRYRPRRFRQLSAHPQSTRGRRTAGVLRRNGRRRVWAFSGSTPTRPRCSWAMSERWRWGRAWACWRYACARSWCS